MTHQLMYTQDLRRSIALTNSHSQKRWSPKTLLPTKPSNMTDREREREREEARERESERAREQESMSGAEWGAARNKEILSNSNNMILYI